MSSQSRPRQHSATSLARFTPAAQPEVDVFHGSKSRDYCNSFWGAGDAGPNIMFTRMRGGSKTTDELRNFWNERCNIEEEYASRLAKLAKAPIGGDEIGELRNSLDILRIETEKQAENHLELANQIRVDLEAHTAEFHSKQVSHRRSIQAPLERKFKEKQAQESYVKKSREKYEGDLMRIEAYTQQASYMQGIDLAKVQQKLNRTKQTIQGNERDYAKFSKDLLDLLVPWEKEWKEYCDSCQDLEEERMDFMKDIMWIYVNLVSTICVHDDQSCERVRTALDKHETEKDIENFVNLYGTGNEIYRPPNFVQTGEHLDPQPPGPPTIKLADFTRVSAHQAPGYPVESADRSSQGVPIEPTQQPSQAQVNGHDDLSIPSQQRSPPHSNPPNQAPPSAPDNNNNSAGPSLSSRNSISGSRINRQSMPLPDVPPGGSRGSERSQTPPPPIPQQPSGNTILFYVKALYDYSATIDEEFDFQAGDVIAVTATPDDGWWSGSSYLNRLVQNTRQAITRRRRHSADPTMPAEDSNIPPVDVFASSNIFGMYDDNDVPITSAYRPPDAPYHAQGYYYDFNNGPDPGPSHFYNYFQPAQQSNNYTTSGWTKDFIGQEVYVGHGKIEEVGSDKTEEEGANHDNASHSRSRLGPLSLNAGDHESNVLLNDGLSYPSTPPCPRLRTLPSLQPTPTPTVSDRHMSFKATTVPAITTTICSSPAQEDPVEVKLVTNSLAMVESSLEDVQFMNTLFLAKSDDHDFTLFSEHIDLCAHIEESLESIRGALTLRTRMGAEEWSVRSPSWHQKHTNRLESLRRTLQRLARLRQQIEVHSLRPRQRIVIHTKLEQHEAKLADLASKCSAAFGRLELRHLHFLLRQSHDEAQNLHKSHSNTPRKSPSFERRWAEGKRLRAGLRADFYDQRNRYSNKKSKSQLRSGRQSSLTQ